MDVRFITSAVTRVAANAFAEQLLDQWDEGFIFRQRELRERDVGGLQATSKRRSVIALGRRDLL